MATASTASAERRTSSDLPLRAVSAVAMIVVAGVALWLGGWWYAGFVGLVAIGVLHEWRKLAFAITPSVGARVLWLVAGLIYIGLALTVLVVMRFVGDAVGLLANGAIIGVTIVIDVCAYTAGRTIGGPKIAPSISPSKTWAGLVGAMVGAAVALMAAIVFWPGNEDLDMPWYAVVIPGAAGAALAVVAQAGDFFESWMKRRAGVKDSGRLLPGHGGLFDRVDGLIPVAIVAGSGLLALLASTR